MSNNKPSNNFEFGPNIRTPLVHIVILNWNGWQDTHACLVSLKDCEYPNKRILLIDNGSTDDSVHQLTKLGYKDILIQSNKNLGFAGGCNVGIRRALSENSQYIWLLNNDTIVRSDTLLNLVSTSIEGGYSATGSVILDIASDSQVQAWGGGFYSELTARNWNFKKRGALKFITGASILIPKQTIQTVGLLDEDFFMYWEDIDFGRRILNAGLALGVSERSFLQHKEGASVACLSTKKHHWSGESLVIFYRKHNACPIAPIFIGIAGRVIRRLLRGNIKAALAILTGAFSGGRKNLNHPS